MPNAEKHEHTEGVPPTEGIPPALTSMLSDASAPIQSPSSRDRMPPPKIPIDHQSSYEKFQYQSYLFFDEPTSSAPAKVTSIFILMVIVMSIIVFTLQTMPELSHVDEDVWWGLDCFATVVFSIEYAFRLWSCVAIEQEEETSPCIIRLRFFVQILNVFDILAIAPFYLEEIIRLSSSGEGPTSSIAFLKVLRAMRLIRLFRVFKLGRYSAGMQLMVQALVNSAQALWVLFFFIVLGVILFSSAVYYMERLGCKIWPHPKDSAQLTLQAIEKAKYQQECDISNNGFTQSDELCCDLDTGAPVSFPSIVAAFWWSIVTMTTVGYGDIVPHTPQGMLVGAICMLLGILLIALPVAIVGSKFQEVYQAMETQTQDKQLELSDVSGKPDDFNPPADDTLAELVKDFDMQKVHPMIKRQVSSLIDLVDNASSLQKRLAHLHAKEEQMHEELHKEFEDFIKIIKEKQAADIAAEEAQEANLLQKLKSNSNPFAKSGALSNAKA